jgi:hypothetical protein
MSLKEAAALSPDEKADRIRARWRLKAKLPKARAQTNDAQRRRTKEGLEARRAMHALFGREWKERLQAAAANG